MADQYGVSKTSLLRHREKCLPAHLLKAKEETDIQSASGLVKQLQELARKTSLVLSRAMAKNDGELALKAIARLERQLELKARLLGELEDRGQTVQHVEVHYVDKAIMLQPRQARLEASPRPRLPEPSG
jgi:hypothetical protein